MPDEFDTAEAATAMAPEARPIAPEKTVAAGDQGDHVKQTYEYLSLDPPMNLGS